MTETITVPLSKLIAWQGNVRKTKPGRNIQQLAASIAAHGLVQSLAVRKDKRGKYAVVAGRRRLLALQLLLEQGVIDKDAPIPCILLSGEANHSEISLAENFQREPMHPADEFDAFSALVEDGMPVVDVAARFGVTENIVRQRLKLARVSPALIGAYRNGEMTLEHLMGFTLTDDHAAQEHVWNELPAWRRNDPSVIRDMLTANEITASDPRVAFVTLDAYEAAGGAVRRDLFSAGDDGVFIDNPCLLEDLVAARLAEVAGQVRAEGWAWVEIRASFDYAEWEGFQRRHPEPVPLSDEEQEELDALIEQAEPFADAHELDDEAQAEFDALQSRIEAIEERATQWPAETLSVGGAVVTLGRDGEADIRRGLVSRKDMARASDQNPKDDTRVKTAKPSMPASLREALSAQRSAAISATVMDRSDVALAILVQGLAGQLLYDRHAGDGVLQITAKAASLHRVEGSRAFDAMNAARNQWTILLPPNVDDLLPWCLSQPAEVLLKLLGYCVSQTVNAVLTKADRDDQPRMRNAARVADALALNMAEWFTPTAENYFGCVTKASIIEALREAKGSIAPAWESMKKAELAKFAEREIATSGWLPEVLRTVEAPLSQAA